MTDFYPLHTPTVMSLHLIQTSRLDGYLRLVSPLEYRAQETMADASSFILQKYQDVTLRQIRSNMQYRWLVRIRMEMIVHFRDVLCKSYPEIGRFMRRDHTSIMSLYRRAKALAEGEQ
ncbi:chromosomal replication initiation ATPase DnaA [Agrobacterium larrymoorei]|uniref:Chromosomal replication initiation ATPase DnaA n=1 Tax=Agrobacterium larrymoorei TaxID=160699 RepID=A0AAJ2BFE9_9HYPH|nr:helix-turn-helix domain-containing protein [Agrobacterium larrymoorei]MDR6102768.1 chromosomal replication initiation ATPase DnaA [Agrobacterium larrymoorei]